MSFTQDIQLTRAIGSKRYADAIELLQLEIRQAKSDQQGLSHLYHLIGWCHRSLGGTEHLELAINAAEQALKIDSKFFAAHCLLAEIYCELDEHVLGMLHVRNAVKCAKLPEQIPVALARLAYFVLLILRGRKAAARYRESAAKDKHGLWLAWAKDYIEWNEQRGTLVAANQVFRPPPKSRS